VVVSVANRTDTIPITCSLDGQAHEVTDDGLSAGRQTGQYQAVCGYLVSAAALAAPIGRPCPECTAVSVTAITGPARRSRHRQPGWLRRILYPSRNAGTGARWLP
jgi:hypothetical protein